METERRISAIQISKILKIDNRSIRRKALKEKWPCIEINNPSGGGKQKLFIYKQLPEDIQKKIIAHELNCDTQLIPQKNFDENKAKAFLSKWESAPEWNRRRAYAKHQILEACRIFCQSNGYKQTTGEKIFIVLYRDKKAPGIEEDIYNREKTFSEGTLRRWRADFQKNGLAGLLMNYKTNSGKSRAITPEIQIFLMGLIGQTPHIKTATLYKLAKKTFNDCPSRKSFYRFIQKWKKENPQTFCLLEDPSKWKNNYMSAFGSRSAGVDHIGHTLEADSTKTDFFIEGIRFCFVAIIDVFSRQVVIVIAPTSKSTAIALCIRKAIMKWGVPTRIRLDNGKDYQSEHITAILESLQIEKPLLAKYAGEEKPFVERFFGTLTEVYEELFPGYCGHSVAERKAIDARKTWASKIMTPGPTLEIKDLTLKDFKELTYKCIENYENTQHRGLNNKTPKEKARESKYFPPKIRDERVLDILLAPVSRPRKIQKKGISIDGVYYHAPELIEHIGKRIIARRDLENAGLIYVFYASTQEYICTATNEQLEGESLEIYLENKKRNEKELKQKVRAIQNLNIGNGSKSALKILLEDTIEHPPEKIIPFQTEADTPAIGEARKAVKDTEGLPPIPEGTLISEETALIKVNKTTDPADMSWMTKEDLDREYEEAMKHAKTRKKIHCM